MGLNERANATFLSITDGKISKKVKEPTAKSTTRTTKEGNTIHEELYPAVTGFIKDVKVIRHEKYGKFWNVTIEDEKDTFILQFNYSGRNASSFLKALPNVDFSKQVRIAPWMRIKDGNKKTSIYINQLNNRNEWEGVPWFFTQEDSKGLPEMKKVRVKGEEAWDDSDMMEFLEKYVEENIIPKLKKAVFMHPEPSTVEDNPRDKKPLPKSVSEDETFDDLPF